MLNYFTISLMSLLAVIGLLDYALPASRIISTFRLVDSRTLDYVLPNSGAEIARCAISPALSQNLAGQRQVLIQRSAVLGRCQAVIALSQAEQHCRQARVRQIMEQAQQHERVQQLSFAQSGYELACRGVIDLPEAQTACDRHTQLTRTLEQDQHALLSYLASYHKQYQAYPAQLSDLQTRLPPLLQERLSNFSYCRKSQAYAQTATCSDGGVSYGDAEISLHPKSLPHRAQQEWSPEQHQQFCLR